MAEKGKRINPNKFGWNYKTKEKVFTTYTDGSKIKLSAEDEAKIKDFARLCTDRALRYAESDIHLKNRPDIKKIVEAKKKVKEEKADVKKEIKK